MAQRIPRLRVHDEVATFCNECTVLTGRNVLMRLGKCPKGRFTFFTPPLISDVERQLSGGSADMVERRLRVDI